MNCTIYFLNRDEEVWIQGKTMAWGVLCVHGVQAANQKQEFHPTGKWGRLRTLLRGAVCPEV